MMRVLMRYHANISSPNPTTSEIRFGPFNSATQRRWRKHVNSAQTRLENRVIDRKVDKVKAAHRQLNFALKILDLISDCGRRFASVEVMSRWKETVGLTVPVSRFLRKHPHVFELFTHPVKRRLCCRTRATLTDLLAEEERVIRALESETVQRVKRLLMMSTSGTLRLHALRLVRREMGLPVDFQHSILAKHSSVFQLVDLETVSLVDRAPDPGAVGEVEKWREKECKEKWLRETETKYAFAVSFPTGFKKGAGFKERLNNWQRLEYIKPYDVEEYRQFRTRGGVERQEKRVVGILHEFLSLTVEKMVEVERLGHFRKHFGMGVNLRELLLKHPGIFYISTKGNTQTVFLREAFHKGCLIESNPVSLVRMKMIKVVLLEDRNTRMLKPQNGIEEKLKPQKEIEEKTTNLEAQAQNVAPGGKVDGDWVLPIFGSNDGSPSATEVNDLSENEPHGSYDDSPSASEVYELYENEPHGSCDDSPSAGEVDDLSENEPHGSYDDGPSASEVDDFSENEPHGSYDDSPSASEVDDFSENEPHGCYDDSPSAGEVDDLSENEPHGCLEK